MFPIPIKGYLKAAVFPFVKLIKKAKDCVPDFDNTIVFMLTVNEIIILCIAKN